MKAVILAGGSGSRLSPLTQLTNKHLLHVYDKPMIYYPIQALVNAGLREVLLVTGGKRHRDFSELLGNGQQLGLTSLSYVRQESDAGVPDALSLAEPFAKGGPICVILGDNLWEANISAVVQKFESQDCGAKVFLKDVPDGHRFGIAELQDGRVIHIEEKPRLPKTCHAVVGIYLYDSTVFDRIRRLKPSDSGESQITDVNNSYAEENALSHEFLDGWWVDAGTFDSLLLANVLAARAGAKAPLKNGD